jgi:hypothetical protein
MKHLLVAFLLTLTVNFFGQKTYCPCSSCEHLTLEAFNSLIENNKLSCGKTYRITEAYHFNSFNRTVDVEVLASSQNTYFASGWIVIGGEHIKADVDLFTPMVRLYEGSTQMVLTPSQCDNWDNQTINEAYSYVELFVLSPNTGLQLLKISLTDDPVTFRWDYVQNMQTGEFGSYNASTDTFTPY